MFCRNCGKEIEGGARFCPLCGSPQGVGGEASPAVLPACCPNCGAPWYRESETDGAGDTLGKALVGGILLGPIGAVGGAAFGNKRIVCFCKRCGLRKEYKASIAKNAVSGIKNIFK